MKKPLKNNANDTNVENSQQSFFATRKKGFKPVLKKSSEENDAKQDKNQENQNLQQNDNSSFFTRAKNGFLNWKSNISYQNKLKEIESQQKPTNIEDQNKLDENEQEVYKKNSKKKKIINASFFIFNIVIVAIILAYQLLREPFVPLNNLGIRGGFVVMLLTIFLLMLSFDIFIISYLIKKDTGRWNFSFGFKTTSIGRYYDAITPMSIGGQPFQVSYLKNHDVSASAALSIPIAKMIFQQMALFVLCAIALTATFINPIIGTSGVIVMASIGFFFTFASLFFVVFLSTSKRLGKKIVVKGLKFLQKIKIVKNYEKQYLRVSNYVEEFQTIMKQYIKNPKDLITMFTFSLLRLVLNYSMPFVIFSCFIGDPNLNLYMQFFMSGLLIDLASGMFPMPGGTGVNEFAFSAIFANFFEGGRLFWALIFWRIMTYYSYILIGIGVLTYDMSYGNRKYKWKKTSTILKIESNKFKDQEIKKFKEDRKNRRKDKYLK